MRCQRWSGTSSSRAGSHLRRERGRVAAAPDGIGLGRRCVSRRSIGAHMRAHRPGGFHPRGPDFEAGALASVPTARTGQVLPRRSGPSSRLPSATRAVPWLPSRRARDCPGGAALTGGHGQELSAAPRHPEYGPVLSFGSSPDAAGAGVAPAQTRPISVEPWL